LCEIWGFHSGWGWWWCFSAFWHHVDLLVDANVLEKHTVSILRDEVAMLGSGGICIGLDGGKAEGMGSLLQPYINSFTSQHRHFSPDDGDSMYLWNVGIYRWVHGAKTQKNNIINNSFINKYSILLNLFSDCGTPVRHSFLTLNTFTGKNGSCCWSEYVFSAPAAYKATHSHWNILDFLNRCHPRPSQNMVQALKTQNMYWFSTWIWHKHLCFQ
jgi:hypothetical protein